jgi:predicted GNAT superfamily acetyltransferase
MPDLMANGNADRGKLVGHCETQNHDPPIRSSSHHHPRDRSRSGQHCHAPAKRDGRVTGFLLASARTTNADVPVVRAMFNAYPGTPDAYVYGPICVDASERGQGLAPAMFAELRRLLPGREGVLFIRHDNEASLRAHRSMGMHEVATFELGGAGFSVFSYVG